MSLELALAENTATLKLVLAALQSGALAPTAVAAAASEAVTPAKPTATRGKGGKATETPAANLQSGVNDGKRASMQLQPGDPEGTRYFHIPEHRTVAAIKPGDVIPSMAGLREITGDTYASLKAEYTSPSSAAAPSTAAAETPAATTQVAPTASSSVPATSPQAASLDGPGIVSKCQALHKAHGNDGLLDVLKHFGVTRVPDLAAKSEKFAEIAAYIDAKLAPPADANLFG